MSTPVQATDIIAALELNTRGRTGSLEQLEASIDGLKDLLVAMLAVQTPQQRYAIYVAIHGDDEHHDWARCCKGETFTP
jgi:hypothetical protein